MVKRFESFYELLDYQNKDNIAFTYFDNEIKNITYKELLEKINNYKLPEEDVIGIFCDNSIESIIAIFSLASKKQIVLLNPNENINTLGLLIKATNIKKLIGENNLVSKLEGSLDKEYKCNTKDILFFTSGTTHKSKAVILDEARLTSASYNGGALLPLTDKDKMISVLPLSHVFGFVCSMLWPLSFGASVCLSRGSKALIYDFDLFKPTVTTLVPEMAKFLAKNKIFNKELKLVLIGAGDCDNKLIEDIKAMGIRVSFGYGLTETSSGIALSVDSDDPKGMKICPDYKVTIAPDGEIIVTSSYTLMKGYYDDYDSTDEILYGNHLLTGDLGKIVDDKLYIIGRKKEVISLPDGTKIFLPEYEANLRKYIGLDSDFLVMKLFTGALGLFIAHPKNVEKKIDEFNKEYPKCQRISQILYLDAIPKTQIGKVQRYKVEER